VPPLHGRKTTDEGPTGALQNVEKGRS
jgi:hypothetical protein